MRFVFKLKFCVNSRSQRCNCINVFFPIYIPSVIVQHVTPGRIAKLTRVRHVGPTHASMGENVWKTVEAIMHACVYPDLPERTVRMKLTPTHYVSIHHAIITVRV